MTPCVRSHHQSRLRAGILGLRLNWLGCWLGWTVGAGYEYALGYGWSIKGEYLYVKFDDYTTFTQPPFGGAGLNIAPRSVKLYDNVIRAGMNYKFY